eukprot:8366236-Alexandrium_andersonii.AAC.1
MSASLVGSEMCIRDRQGESEPVRAVTGSGKLMGLFTHRLRRSPGPPPVSYTHLTLPTICSV